MTWLVSGWSVAKSSSVGRLKEIHTAVRGDDNLLHDNVSMSTACLWNRRKTSARKTMKPRRDVDAAMTKRRRRKRGAAPQARCRGVADPLTTNLARPAKPGHPAQRGFRRRRKGQILKQLAG